MLEKNKQISMINNKIFWRKKPSIFYEDWNILEKVKGLSLINNKMFCRKSIKYLYWNYNILEKNQEVRGKNMSLWSCPHQKFPTKSKMCYCQVNWAQSVLACLAKSRLSFEKEDIFEKLNFLFFWKCASSNLSGRLGAVSPWQKYFHCF